MKQEDKRSIGIFGFRRSRGKRPAVAILAISILVTIFAVWFVVIRH